MDFEGLKKALQQVRDPRRDYGNIRHKLESILFIVLCSALCGGEGFEDCEEFGETREDWLRNYIDLPNGLPCAETFRRILQRIHSGELLRYLNEWIGVDPLDGSGGRLVNIDGKTIRGSSNPREGQSAFHVISAWVGENNITLGQLATDGKSNEITAIPELLDMIDIRGDIVTIDAMGCQKEIAQRIRKKEADYILAVKSNHPTLHEDIQAYFDWAQREPDKIALGRWVGKIEKDHGRIERREVATITDVEHLRRAGEWVDLSTVIRYSCTQYTQEGETRTDRYYISSFDTTPEQFAYLIRDHWSIENQLHWMLDVLFCEDASKAKKDNAPLNMSVFRKIALRLLRNTPTDKKVSARRKMLRAALDVAFLEMVLFRR